MQRQTRKRSESEHPLAAAIRDSEPASSKDLGDIAALAACICETPFAIVALLNGSVRVPVAQAGLTTAQAKHVAAFCARIQEESPFAVRDAALDVRLRDDPLVVGEPHVRFCAGAPIRNDDGLGLGMLYVLDRVPRDLSATQRRALQMLCERVVMQLQSRDRLNELQSRHKEIEQTLAASKHLAAIVESSDDAIIGNDLDGVITSWNQGAERLLGYTADEITGSSIRRIMPADRQEEEDRMRYAIRRGMRVGRNETLRQTKDGRLIAVAVTASPIVNDEGAIVGVSKTLRELAAAHGHQPEAERLSRVYAAVHQINQAIVWIHSRDELLQRVCQVLVDFGGFAMTWIGFFSAQTRLIEPAAAHGDNTYVQRIRVYGDDRPEGRGPTGYAFRTGTRYVCNDLLEDAATVPWRAEAERHGFRASAAFPIREKGAVIGTLNVYAKETGYFGDKEIALLDEAAHDVSFGLDNLKRDEERRRAEIAVARERRFSEVMIESLPGILYFYDERGRFLRWNRNFEIATGYSAEEVASMRPLDFFAQADKPLLKEKIAEVFRVGASSVEAPLLAKDGTTTAYFFTGRRIELDGALHLVGMGIDISERIAAEAARLLSEARYRRLFECAPEGIIIADGNSVYLDANAAMCRMLGYSHDELVGMSASDIVDASETPHIGPALQVIKSGAGYHREWLFRRKDGSKFVAEVVGALMPDGNLMGMVRDISGRKDQERKIARLDRIRAVAGGISSAMLRTHDRETLLQEACRVAVKDGVFQFAWATVLDPEAESSRVVAMEGADVSDFIKSLERLLPISERPREGAMATGKAIVINDLPKEPSLARFHDFIQAWGCMSGGAFPLFIADRPVAVLSLLSRERHFFDDEELTLINWLTKDLSYALENIENAQRLQHLAYFDALTGLANASLFRDRLSQFILAAVRNKQKVCVVVIDLENFTRVNETLGRAGGDELLCAIAKRLQISLIEPYALGRIGADTFAVAGPGDGESIATSLRDQILGALAAPFSVQGLDMAVSAQAGIALFPDDAHDDDTLFKHAEAALKLAKSSSRPSAYFSRALNDRVASRLALEVELREAVAAAQFVLHYQPRVDMFSGEIVGAEALIRWEHPTRGIVKPAEFIPLAEQTGLIIQIGEWVIDRICAQQAAWLAADLPTVPIAANLSTLDLEHGGIVATVRAALKRHALDAPHLHLELTESAVMHDAAAATRIMHELRKLGISLALDDFGTGYSSLAYLKRFPFNRVKIDRSFVTDITHSAEDAMIASAIIAIGHSMGLKVVAEGIETEGQYNYLRAQGCDEMQGQYFSDAISAETLASYLQERRSIKSRVQAAQSEQAVLVVDDEAGIRSALMRLLRRDGYRVLTAASASEGLDLLAVNHVQVIVADQLMPGMSGTEFFGKVKQLYPQTMRIILSGYAELDVVIESVNRGAVFKFLTKPWDDDMLREHVRDAFLRYQPARSA